MKVKSAITCPQQNEHSAKCMHKYFNALVYTFTFTYSIYENSNSPFVWSRIYAKKATPERLILACNTEKRISLIMNVSQHFMCKILLRIWLREKQAIVVSPLYPPIFIRYTLQWRHNGGDSVSNHQPHDCLLNRSFRRRSKKTSKLRVTGQCAGNSLGTGEFSAQMSSSAENVSIWWRHHEMKHLMSTAVFEVEHQDLMIYFYFEHLCRYISPNTYCMS